MSAKEFIHVWLPMIVIVVFSVAIVVLPIVYVLSVVNDVGDQLDELHNEQEKTCQAFAELTAAKSDSNLVGYDVEHPFLGTTQCLVLLDNSDEIKVSIDLAETALAK